jgi:hypothetical protein
MHWKHLAAGQLLVIALLPALLSCQDAAAGIDPATLAKANAGDAAAQFLVGHEYEKGDVVPRDFAQAAVWFRKAADQGNAQAQCSLGVLFQRQNAGMPEDDAQAAMWLRKAADQGLATAQYRLGLSYSQGKGVPQDDAQAASWYQKAVLLKDPDAMVKLAQLYARGQGVPRDEKQAFALDQQAAELGAADGEYQLGLAYETGQGVKKDKGQAIDWYRKAAEQGVTLAQFNLAQLLGSNHAEAYFWLSLAAPLLEGPAFAKASVLRDDAASKLKPGEQAAVDQRVQQWHPTHPAPQ